MVLRAARTISFFMGLNINIRIHMKMNGNRHLLCFLHKSQKPFSYNKQKSYSHLLSVLIMTASSNSFCKLWGIWRARPDRKLSHFLWSRIIAPHINVMHHRNRTQQAVHSVQEPKQRLWPNIRQNLNQPCNEWVAVVNQNLFFLAFTTKFVIPFCWFRRKWHMAKSLSVWSTAVVRK